MPRKGAKDTVPLFVELPPELDRRLREHCELRSSKITDEVRLAIRRHLDYPPADVAPPLPPNGGTVKPAAPEPKNYATGPDEGLKKPTFAPKPADRPVKGAAKRKGKKGDAR